MSVYEKDILIDELQKLVVSKTLEIKIKDIEIDRLKKQVERSEAKVKN